MVVIWPWAISIALLSLSFFMRTCVWEHNNCEACTLAGLEEGMWMMGEVGEVGGGDQLTFCSVSCVTPLLYSMKSELLT